MNPEPWLRGIRPDIDPVVGHLLRSSEHIREDAARGLSGLSVAQIWDRPFEMTPVGFHAKHLAGSTERLCTYLAGGALSREQLVAMRYEGAGSEGASELIAAVNHAFDRYDELIRGLADFTSMRFVGRARLEVTAIGLAIHIAEHGQRHAGQLISAAKLSGSGRLAAGGPR